MIIIVSYEQDHSTNDVIKYLRKKNIKYLRIGNENYITSININIGKKTSVELFIDNHSVFLKDITAFWYRKNDIKLFDQIEIDLIQEESLLNSPKLSEYLSITEKKSIRDYLIHELEKKKHIGNINKGNGNKLISFSIANEVGLSIPETFISSNLQWLKSKLLRLPKLIAKPIEDAYGDRHNGIQVVSSYELIDQKSFKNKADVIFPSCLQEYVNKKIELRIFYLKGDFYSMAIFSQSDEKTKIDFRNYNNEKPNRMVPYKLPKSIEMKLSNFMKKMGLNTGSIDMILTDNNEYIFLEVNPAGQYGMISEFCNYNLDRLIADELISNL